MRLSHFILGTQDPEKTIAYYSNKLGMQLLDSQHNEMEERFLLAFPGHQPTTSLELRLNKQKNIREKYSHHPSDSYWKYSLFVDDIQRTYKLLDNDYVIQEPRQFGDIGYLLHTREAENYMIEFIQKRFKQNTQPSTDNEKYPLREIPVLGLITLRTKDVLKSIRFYERFFKMKLFVRMYVDKKNGRKFALYFLGNKNLQPPNPDIDAVENREWMYQQAETFIELQYVWGTEHQSDFEYDDKLNNRLGFKGICFKSKNLEVVESKLLKANILVAKHYDALWQKEILELTSPDKHPVIVI